MATERGMEMTVSFQKLRQGIDPAGQSLFSHSLFGHTLGESIHPVPIIAIFAFQFKES
jgi:hypothetical protein